MNFRKSSFEKCESFEKLLTCIEQELYNGKSKDGDEKNGGETNGVNGDGDTGYHVGNGIGGFDGNDNGVNGCDDKAGESNFILNVSCWEKKKRHVENILERVNGMEDSFLEVFCLSIFKVRTF